MKKILIFTTALIFAFNLNAQTPKPLHYAEVQRGYRWDISPCGPLAQHIYLNWEETATWDIPEGVIVYWITDRDSLQFKDSQNNDSSYVAIHPKYKGLMPLIWCEEEQSWLYSECGNRIQNIKTDSTQLSVNNKNLQIAMPSIEWTEMTDLTDWDAQMKKNHRWKPLLFFPWR